MNNYQDMYESLLKENEKQEKRLNIIIKQNDAQTKELLKLNEKLEEAAHTDPMTGAYNRRYFYETAKNMIALSQREGYSITIAMLDIDKFKNINDTYGHDIGDIIIKDFTKQIASCMRTSDMFARFGGEEFVILLNHITKEDAIAFCNKVRLTVQASDPVDDIKYAVSIGVSEILTTDNNVDDALKRSDLGLYEAKETGRNRVIHHSDLAK